MKRTPALLLAFFLLLSIFAPAFAETQIGEEYQRTLWDIPWGVSRDEFRTLAEAKTGILFYPDEPDTDLSGGIRSVDNQNILILGCPVLYINGSFSKNPNTLGGITIFYATIYPQYKKYYSIEDCSILLNRLYSNLVTQYGAPTGGYFRLTQPSGMGTLNFALPISTDTQAYEAFLQMHDEANHVLDVTVYFGNIQLYLWCYERSENQKPGEIAPIVALYTRSMTEDDIQEQINKYKDLPVYGAEEASSTSAPVIDIGL